MASSASEDRADDRANAIVGGSAFFHQHDDAFSVSRTFQFVPVTLYEERLAVQGLVELKLPA